MIKKCLKCGYERVPSDIAPKYECPKCGAVYAKVEKALHRKSSNETQNIQYKGAYKKIPATGIDINKGFIEQFKNAPLLQKVFIIFILVFGAIAFLYNHSPFKKEQIIIDSTYKYSENLNGVRFYNFNSKNAPKLEPTNNFTDLNYTQLNSILSLIQDIPKLPKDLSFRKGGKHIFSTELNQDERISIHIRQCNKKTNPYSCIEKIIYSPNAKEMAKIKAQKMPNRYIFISEEEYGSNWPYTFQYGLVTCNGYSDVVIIAQHKVYAINGTAMGAKYPSGEKMYDDDWNVRKPLSGSGRMPPPSDIIQKGLSLCRDQ
jgi:predicted RNA-binding Zn-ribbon protein involved in translation (DUF1610 family)